MAKNRKTVRKAFDYLHCDDFAAYLQDMAAKGWHFVQWRAGLVFEKGEPEQAVYAVEVFIDGSEYDTRPEVHTQEFAEYCEAAGWKLIDARQKFCVFKKVRPDAAEILTPEERLENISREVRKDIWQKLGTSGVWVLLQLLNFTGHGFVNRIFSNQSLLITMVWVMFFLAAAGRAVYFYLWKHRTTRMLREGKDITFGKGRSGFRGGLYSWLTVAAGGLFFLSMWAYGQYSALVFTACMIAGLVLMEYLIAKFRPDSVTNQLIQTLATAGILLLSLTFMFVTVVTDEEAPDPAEVPFRLEDIGAEAGALEEVLLEGEESVFGTALWCGLTYEEEYVLYYVYKSPHSWILDRIWEEKMEAKYNQLGTDCAEQWGAEAAIYSTADSYLVRWQNAILIFNGAEDTQLTKAQCEIIRSALDVG